MSNSKEHKANMRLQRKTPSERRKQAIQKCFGIVIEKPVHKICQLTIPITEKEKWNRSLSSIHPTMGLLFMLYSANSLNLYDFRQQIALAVSINIGVVIRFCTYKTRAPSDRVYVVFQLGAFLMGMVWVYMLANIIVDMLELFAMLTGMSAALLGLTILSWGNS